MTKTGSTSIEAALAPYGDIIFTHSPAAKHMQLRKFERFIRPYLKSIDQTEVETACLFREPIDWLGSWYRYRRRPALSGHANSTDAINFDQFVAAYLATPQTPFSQVGRQSKFVTKKNGDIGIDHLFKYDHFDDFLVFLSDRIGQTIAVPRLNISPAQPLELSKQLRNQLETELALDFEIYGTYAR